MQLLDRFIDFWGILSKEGAVVFMYEIKLI